MSGSGALDEEVEDDGHREGGEVERQVPASRKTVAKLVWMRATFRGITAATKVRSLAALTIFRLTTR